MEFIFIYVVHIPFGFAYVTGVKSGDWCGWAELDSIS